MEFAAPGFPAEAPSRVTADDSSQGGGVAWQPH
jgi:hypothetical protein